VVDMLAGIVLDGAGGGGCLAGVYNHCCLWGREGVY
jgi:hypothetical protein